MKQVGIFEAKTRLSSLVDEVERGEEVVITRHGEPVARLIGISSSRRVQSEQSSPELVARRKKALARLQEIARELKINPTHEEIKNWIAEGRK